MYAVIQNTEKGYLPSLVNMNDERYCDMVMAGYETIEKGTRKEMQEIVDNMIVEFASNLD